MITTIPFKVLNIDNEGFHLLIKLRINRKIAKMIIDTGASKSVFDKGRIEQFVPERNFDVHDKMSSGLGTNTMQSQTTRIKKMKIGEIEILDYKAVLLDLSHVNQSYEQIGLNSVDGVLGSDILLQYHAIIDYDKKTLKLKYNKRRDKK
jgi:predicted aspartyl protease